MTSTVCIFQLHCNLTLFPIQKLMMVTAYSGVQELKNEKLKKIRVMAKPFEFEELFATIRAGLDIGVIL